MKTAMLILAGVGAVMILPTICLLQAQSKPPTPTSVGIVHTIKHDGHEFVVWRDGSVGGIIHHPGCK